MSQSSNQLGRIGERVAASWLIARGYVVIARNWRCNIADLRGEIDIVARTADGTTLVFCEVKSRRRMEPSGPLWAVDGRKQRQLRRLAAAYVSLTGEHGPDLRFDAIAVAWPAQGGAAVVTHLPGAF